MTETEKLNACVYALIGLCEEANSEKTTITMEGVNHLDKFLGDWRVTIEKIYKHK